MPRYVLRRDADSNTGLYVLAAALGGMAAGYLLATRGKHLNLGGLSRQWREFLDDMQPFPEAASGAFEDDPFDDDAADDLDDAGLVLERRVLTAFEHDPVLATRAVDISALDGETVELSGWVRRPAEIDHAVTIARGVPGVANVESRLRVRRPAGAR